MTSDGSRLERFLVGAARAVSGGSVHPLAVLQAIEQSARESVSEGVVANVYFVEMNPADAGQFAPQLDALRAAAVQMLDDFRESRRLRILSPWDVDFGASARTAGGSVRVAATFRNPGAAASAPSSSRSTEVLTRQANRFIHVEGVGRVRLTHTPFSIGRSPQCDLVLADLSVSRVHARIEQVPGGQLVVRDKGSRNRLVVGGEALDYVPLEPGVRVTIGSTTLWLEEPG